MRKQEFFGLTAAVNKLNNFLEIDYGKTETKKISLKVQTKTPFLPLFVVNTLV